MEQGLPGTALNQGAVSVLAQSTSSLSQGNIVAPVLAEIEYPRSTQGPGFETLAPATSMMADSSFLVDVKVASVRSVDASMFGIESFDSGNEMNGNADEAFATAAATAAAATVDIAGVVGDALAHRFTTDRDKLIEQAGKILDRNPKSVRENMKNFTNEVYDIEHDIEDKKRIKDNKRFDYQIDKMEKRESSLLAHVKETIAKQRELRQSIFHDDGRDTIIVSDYINDTNFDKVKNRLRGEVFQKVFSTDTFENEKTIANAHQMGNSFKPSNVLFDNKANAYYRPYSDINTGVKQICEARSLFLHRKQTLSLKPTKNEKAKPTKNEIALHTAIVKLQAKFDNKLLEEIVEQIKGIDNQKIHVERNASDNSLAGEICQLAHVGKGFVTKCEARTNSEKTDNKIIFFHDKCQTIIVDDRVNDDFKINSILPSEVVKKMGPESKEWVKAHVWKEEYDGKQLDTEYKALEDKYMKKPRDETAAAQRILNMEKEFVGAKVFEHSSYEKSLDRDDMIYFVPTHFLEDVEYQNGDNENILYKNASTLTFKDIAQAKRIIQLILLQDIEEITSIGYCAEAEDENDPVSSLYEIKMLTNVQEDEMVKKRKKNQEDEEKLVSELEVQLNLMEVDVPEFKNQRFGLLRKLKAVKANLKERLTSRRKLAYQLLSESRRSVDSVTQQRMWMTIWSACPWDKTLEMDIKTKNQYQNKVMEYLTFNGLGERLGKGLRNGKQLVSNVVSTLWKECLRKTQLIINSVKKVKDVVKNVAIYVFELVASVTQKILNISLECIGKSYEEIADINKTIEGLESKLTSFITEEWKKAKVKANSMAKNTYLLNKLHRSLVDWDGETYHELQKQSDMNKHYYSKFDPTELGFDAIRHGYGPSYHAMFPMPDKFVLVQSSRGHLVKGTTNTPTSYYGLPTHEITSYSQYSQQKMLESVNKFQTTVKWLKLNKNINLDWRRKIVDISDSGSSIWFKTELPKNYKNAIDKYEKQTREMHENTKRLELQIKGLDKRLELQIKGESANIIEILVKEEMRKYDEQIVARTTLVKKEEEKCRYWCKDYYYQWDEKRKKIKKISVDGEPNENGDVVGKVVLELNGNVKLIRVDIDNVRAFIANCEGNLQKIVTKTCYTELTMDGGRAVTTKKKKKRKKEKRKK